MYLLEIWFSDAHCHGSHHRKNSHHSVEIPGIWIWPSWGQTVFSTQSAYLWLDMTDQSVPTKKSLISKILVEGHNKNLQKSSCRFKTWREFIWQIFSCDQAALWMVQYVCLSVTTLQAIRLSVRPSHLFDYVPIIVSSWNFQELLPMTEVTSMQKVKVRGQRSRSQRSTPNLTVSRP